MMITMTSAKYNLFFQIVLKENYVTITQSIDLINMMITMVTSYLNAPPRGETQGLISMDESY